MTQHPEITLQHAIKYLEPFGVGRDMEYSRARCILQYALTEVKRGQDLSSSIHLPQVMQ